VETVVNPLQLYHDISDLTATASSLDEIKLLLTIRSTYRTIRRRYNWHSAGSPRIAISQAII